MFAVYDYTRYESHSIVTVTLNSQVENDKDFDDFLLQWLNLYIKKRMFTLIFDTSNVGYIPLIYSLRMSAFIGNLKKQKHQFLDKSIILINSNIVKHMLDFIFMIQAPVAPVYITNNIAEIDMIVCDKPTSATIILPHKSIF
jgi:hypothetical protein|tara:strand:- start:57 stop:482 length:426 start_codon:yes stop_codon:yes gene_type:complete